MMDGNTSRGLNAVRRIKQQHNLTGCYGTIAELIEVGQHHTAIEVVAGASLFHYVVDNEETATKVMDILTKERLGRGHVHPFEPRAIEDCQYATSTRCTTIDVTN